MDLPKGQVPDQPANQVQDLSSGGRTFGDSPLSGLLEHLQGSQVQSLLKRVDELRGRLLKILMMLTGLVCVGFFFARDVLLLIKSPLYEAIPNQSEVLHFTGPLEVMMSYMKVSFLLAAFLAAPYIFYQLWQFVGPALPPKQRRYVVPFVASSLTLFLVGASFCFFVMVPIGLKWLVGFGGDQAVPVITVEEYVDLVTFMLLAFGAAFQLPLVVILLERLGIISEAMLTKNRGGILVGILIIAAVVTPSPDPFSMVAMAVPMYLLFEAAIVVIRRIKRQDANVPG